MRDAPAYIALAMGGSPKNSRPELLDRIGLLWRHIEM